MGSPRLRPIALAVVALTGAATTAHAAPGDTVRHSASVDGHLATDSSQVLPAWTPSAAVATTYLRRIGLGPTDEPSVDARLQMDLLFAFGIADWAQLELALPTAVHQRGTTYESGRFVTLPGASVGDLRIGARGTLLRTPRRGFGLGLGFDATAPSGHELGTHDLRRTDLHAYRARRVPRTPRHHRGDQRRVLGTTRDQHRHRGGGDTVPYRLAVRVPVAPREAFALFAELDGQATMVRGGESPLAARGGFRWQTRGGLVMNLWGGGGLLTAVGLPTLQLGLSAGFAPGARMRTRPAFEGNEKPSAVALVRHHDRALLAALDEPPPKAIPHPDDPDGDGILARADLCPNVPEDRDGTQDRDGCPELDDDRDGLPDVVDLCPSAPEIINGYRDLDGCPDKKLAEGGQTFDRFEARQLLPALHFPKGSATVDATMNAQLDELAELLRLNPWIERLQLAVFVPQTKDANADRRLADARAEAIHAALDARGVDRWRVEALPAKTVPEGTPERVRLTFSGRASALDPVAPSPATLERIIAESRADDEDTAPDTMEAQGPAAEGDTPQSDGPR